jgi:hypothetical protein
MAIHTEASGAEVVARAAAAAILQVQDQVADLSGSHGRSGVISRLRVQSKELSSSGVAFDQIRSLALERAADDIAWGRPPLANWSTFIDEQDRPSSADRFAVRLQVGPPEPADEAAAHELSRAIIARVLAEEEDAFSAARRFPLILRRESVLQDTLWDDPRLLASPEARRLMRSVAAVLLEKLGPCTAPTIAREPQPPSGIWRRLLGRVQAYAGLR